MIPFKDVGGSRIIFAGPSKVFTRANKDQQRESNHAVYSLCNSDILGDSVTCGVGGDVRFDSNIKMKTSPSMESSKEEYSKLIELCYSYICYIGRYRYRYILVYRFIYYISSIRDSSLLSWFPLK